MLYPIELRMQTGRQCVGKLPDVARRNRGSTVFPDHLAPHPTKAGSARQGAAVQSEPRDGKRTALSPHTAKAAAVTTTFQQFSRPSLLGKRSHHPFCERGSEVPAKPRTRPRIPATQTQFRAYPCSPSPWSSPAANWTYSGPRRVVLRILPVGFRGKTGNRTIRRGTL